MHIDCNYIQAKFDWLGHIVEAVCQALITAALTWLICVHLLRVPSTFEDCLLIGGAVAVGHFWGREKRDYERKTNMPPPQLKSYFIWKWEADNFSDFLPVLGIYLGYCVFYLYTHSPLIT